MGGPWVSSPFPYVVGEDGLTYIMLVNQLNQWTCDLELDILMAEPTGRRGDVDNRLKTLFDGFHPPQTPQTVGVDGTAPSDGLVFCLLEDDKDRFIRSRRVELEPLLRVPPALDPSERTNYVSVRIGVTVKDADGGAIRVAGAP